MRYPIISLLLLVASAVFGQDQFGDLTDINLWVKYTDPLSVGLVGWWNMNEGSGITVNDLSGNGNTGTVTNGAPWAAGHSGTALSFTAASSQYVNVPDSPSLQTMQNAGSVAFWVFLSPLAVSQCFVSKGNPLSGTGYNAFGVAANSGTFYGCMLGNAAQSSNIGVAVAQIPTNTWLHIVMVWDTVATPNIRAWYTNGVIASSFSSAVYGPTATGSPLRFGCGASGSGAINGPPANYANCQLDDVRVYSRALTASDIAMLYAR